MKYIIIAAFVAMLAACSGKVGSDPAKKSDPFDGRPKDKAVYETLVWRDIEVFEQGGNSAVGYFLDIERVSADEILSVYEENEVLGDQRFKGRDIVLSGKIKAINSGIGDEPYLTFRVKDMFSSPQAHFADGYKEKAAAMKKGAEVSLYCTGGGEAIGTPLLRNCIPIKDAVANIRKMLSEDVVRAYGKKSPEFVWTTGMLVFTRAIANKLPADFTCEGLANYTCEQKVTEAIGEKKAARDELIAAGEELKAEGVKVNQAALDKISK